MTVLTSMLWLALAASSTSATPPKAASPAATPPARQAKALLEVLCIPSSKIYIDGQVRGHSRFPLFTNIEVTAGKHRLACETRAGRKSVEEEISIGAGETKVIERRVE